MPSCAAEKKRHFLADCPCDPAEIEKMKESLRSRPPDGTRSKTAAIPRNGPSTNKFSSFVVDKSPCAPIDIVDGDSSLIVTGKCDDGSDDSLASPQVATKAVSDGIGSFRKITPVSFQVALTRDVTPQEFTFCKVWTVPLTVCTLHLAS